MRSLRFVTYILLLGLVALFFFYPATEETIEPPKPLPVEQKEPPKPADPKPEMANDMKNTTFGRHVNLLKFSWETLDFTEKDLYKIAQDSIVVDEIPRIIHQSWKTTTLDGNFRVWSNSWKRIHPDFTYILWTDEDNRLLVQKYYPWFLPAYDMFPRKIMRIDLIRCVYLHRYGGLYADLDVIPIKSHITLYKKYSKFGVILGSISSDDNFEHNVPNAWMASKPGHDFWLMNLNLATQRAYSYPTSAEGVSGPILVKDCMLLWNRNQHNDIKLLEPGLIYGIDWRHERPEPCSSPNEIASNQTTFERCKSIFPNMFALTVWSHSWE